MPVVTRQCECGKLGDSSFKIHQKNFLKSHMEQTHPEEEFGKFQSDWQILGSEKYKMVTVWIS